MVGDRMRWKVAIAIAFLVAVVGVANYLRPIPTVQAASAVPKSTTIAGTTPALPWPSVGSAAVAVSGLGPIATSGNEQSAPAASVTKVMTALLVLEDKPLKAGEQGPSMTITDLDVQAFLADKADQQSVVEVRTDELLTEFQALEALLVPSGNNIAFTLARWDAGSVDVFIGKMNKRGKALGMSHTTFADTAGASIESVSTPSDLVALGMAAMKQPVFAQIVALPQAILPVAGKVFNVNYVLGQSGIVGIKTGSGFNLGASFLYAATVTVDGRAITLYGCVMGQPTLALAFTAAKALIAAMQPYLSVKRIIARNGTAGSYELPWGGGSDLLSTSDVDLVEWPGMVLSERLDAPAIVVDKPLAPGTAEGSLHVELGDYKLDVPLVTAASLYPPGRMWRLTRIG